MLLLGRCLGWGPSSERLLPAFPSPPTHSPTSLTHTSHRPSHPPTHASTPRPPPHPPCATYTHSHACALTPHTQPHMRTQRPQSQPQLSRA